MQTPSLMKFSLSELQAISVKCGQASTVSRTRQLEALKYFYNSEVSNIFPLNPGPILSMDLGLCNLAACEIESIGPDEAAVYQILKWNKYDLGLPEVYNPLRYAEAVKKFTEKELLSSFTGKFIFIERQRHRSGSNSVICETIVRLAILEAQLHCYLSQNDYQTIPVTPGSVAKFFDLPKGKEKKSGAVGVVKEMLRNKQNLSLEPSLENFFLKQKKQDDLADCLLQAIASLEFRKNCRNFIKSLEITNEHDKTIAISR